MNNLLKTYRYFRKIVKERNIKFAPIITIGMTSALLGLILPWFSKFFVDEILIGRSEEYLWPFLFLWLAFDLLSSIGDGYNAIYSSYNSSTITFGMPILVIQKVHNFTKQLFKKYQLSDFLVRIDEFGASLDTVGDLIVEALEIVVYLIALPFLFLIIDKNLFFIVGTTVLAIVITSYIFSNYIKRIYLFNRRMFTSFERQLTLIFQNLFLIREFNLKETIDKEIGVQNYKINELTLRKAAITRSNKFINRTIYLFGSFFYRVLSVGLVYSGKMSIGDFFAYNMILQLLFSPIEMLTSMIKPVKELMVNSERTMEFLSKEEQYNGNAAMPSSGKLEVNNLRFHYDDESSFLIKDFNCTFESGKMYGIVGHNGCGKSTLLTLLARLNDPKDGMIRFGGVPIREIKKELYHSNVHYIDSTGFIFPTTFERNIICNSEYNDDKFNYIINELQIGKLREQFPKYSQFFSVGMSTSLSNGECQKICIARVLYSDKKICLFDEAFSYLDFYSKMNILKTLRKMLHDSVVIIVSHDLTVIRKLDYVLYMDGGSLIESGYPRELLEKESKFSRLFNENH
jgi:ATP-binding cassette, subfamily B, bacterial